MLTQRLGGEIQTTDENTDKLLAMIKDNPKSCDEVWFSSLYGFPKTEVHRGFAKRIAVQAQKYRNAGIRVSLQISNTIGHGEYMSKRDCSGLVYDGSPVQGLTAHDGTCAKYSFCWRDRYFRDYICDMIEAYLVIKPDTVWFDDDFRPSNHRPVEFGCFCDNCISRFNKEYGSDFSREELVKEITFGSLECRKAFIEFTKQGLSEFMAECCQTIHSVLPGTKVGLQQGTMGGFIGDSGNEYLYETIHEVTGLPVSVRPGGGAYTDHDMREFIQKGNEIERQIRECPLFVTDLRPEIESLPYVAYGKSAAATCFETTFYFAVGANAMSYAMMMDAREDYSWYRKEFEAFSKHREYWEMLANTNKKSVQTGVNAVYPDGRWSIKCKEPLEYSKSDQAEESILRYISLPMSYRRNSDGVQILHGSDASRISDKTVGELLKKPLITDGETIKVLSDRGYKFNIEVKEINTLKLYEAFTDHEINNGVLRREWTGKFAGWRTGYKLIPLNDEVEVIARYKSPVNGTENEGEIATAVIKTEAGAKWAVFGFEIWNRIVSTSRRDQIFNTVEYIGEKPLPARLVEAFSSIVLTREYKNGNMASVSVVNCTSGESGEYSIIVEVPEGKKALYMSENGEKTELMAGKDGIFKMPSILPWNVATLFFEE